MNNSLKEISHGEAWVDVISGVEDEDLISEDVIDKLIADHEKAIKDYRTEIKMSKRSIENLEYKKKKLKYGADTVIFEVADTLHDKCTSIHNNATIIEYVDSFKVCIYRDATWDDYTGNHSRLIYYNKAKRVIEKANELKISIRKAIQLINEI
ncbi:hypothetical protein BH09PAT1_BH09PAT1_6340 [soil metagenome]